MEPSPRRLAQHRQALIEFQNGYAAYLRAGPGHNKLRARVVDLIPASQAALNEAGVGVLVGPPPMLPGSMAYEGLSNTAFLHERSGLYEDAPSHVNDVTRLGIAELERRERDLAHRRRNPLYWGDRLLSLLLGFPSYLVGKIIGMPAARIDATAWGTILRVAELAAAGLGVYLGGRNAGWW